MRPQTLTLLILAILFSVASRADATPDQTAGMNIGVALGWRLGPEAVAERCRTADPEGVEIRQKAVRAWLAKNSRLIQAVDERIAEVVPLLSPKESKEAVIAVVQARIRDMVLEPLFADKSPAEVTAICKAESDPAKPRWNNPGMPMVALVLAELYDWKVQREAK